MRHALPGSAMRLAILMVFGVVMALAAQSPRESILDRKVHLEQTIIPVVPNVPRLCDTLGIPGRKVDIGGCKLHVEEEGRGTPLLLINGGPGGTHHSFHPWFHQAAEFAHVIYYDQRGCGLSDWEPGPGYTVEQAVGDLEALRKQLHCERWTVLGWSYGGFLAQLYAIRYPEHTAGLVLVGACPGLGQDFGSREGGVFSKEELAHFQDVKNGLVEIQNREHLDERSYVALSIFNMILNGDWKRQSFYRPTPEEAARTARYEWNNPPEFNGALSQSMRRYDLEGAFTGFPAPTLILEGRWDLTWGEQKPQVLLANHPGAAMKVFDRSAHAIFSEETEAFFLALRQFLADLPKEGDPSRMASYQDHVARWREQMAHPVFPIHWGATASKAIRLAPEAWLKEHPGDSGMLRLGFAYYDGKAFGPALECFQKLETLARQKKDSATEVLAVLWEGHMLDLLSRRQDALCCYQRVKDAGKSFRFSNDQYGLRYNSVDYPGIRLQQPFTFHPNQE